MAHATESAVGKEPLGLRNWIQARVERKEQKMFERFVEKFVDGDTDFWLWHISERVEWNTLRGMWGVLVTSMDDLVINVGERVVLKSGRGGEQEYAFIREAHVGGRAKVYYLLHMEKA